MADAIHRVTEKGRNLNLIPAPTSHPVNGQRLNLLIPVKKLAVGIASGP